MQGLRNVLRLRQNGLLWMAPICSSFVSACYSVSYPGLEVSFSVCNFLSKISSHVLAEDIMLHWKATRHVGQSDESRLFFMHARIEEASYMDGR